MYLPNAFILNMSFQKEFLWVYYALRDKKERNEKVQCNGSKLSRLMDALSLALFKMLINRSLQYLAYRL